MSTAETSSAILLPVHDDDDDDENRGEEERDEHQFIPACEANNDASPLQQQRPPRRCDSLSSDLSAITEDADDVVLAEIANRSLFSGRWVAEEEPQKEATASVLRVVVDKSNIIGAIRLFDDDDDDDDDDELQREAAPTEQESSDASSSWGSAVHRVKRRLETIRLERARERGRNDSPASSLASYLHHYHSPAASPLSNGNVSTLSQLKLERDFVVAQTFEKEKLARRRRAKMVDVTRATLAVVAYCQLVMCDLSDLNGKRQEISLASVELAGVLFICYLSTVEIDAPKERHRIPLHEILFSRKATLLITYLVMWSFLFDAVVASLFVAREQYTKMWARRQTTTLTPTVDGESPNLLTVENIPCQVVSNGDKVALEDTTEANDINSFLTNDYILTAVAEAEAEITHAALEDTDSEGELSSVNQFNDRYADESIQDLDSVICRLKLQFGSYSKENNFVWEDTTDGDCSIEFLRYECTFDAAELKRTYVAMEDATDECSCIDHASVDESILGSASDTCKVKVRFLSDSKEADVASEDRIDRDSTMDLSTDEYTSFATELKRSLDINAPRERTGKRSSLNEVNNAREKKDQPDQESDGCGVQIQLPAKSAEIVAEKFASLPDMSEGQTSEKEDNPISRECLQRWAQAALKKPLAVPPFVRTARHHGNVPQLQRMDGASSALGDHGHADMFQSREAASADELDAQTFLDTSFGDFRMSVLSTINNDLDEHQTPFTSRLRLLVRNSFRRLLAPFAGNNGETDEPIFDTIAEVWAGRE